MENIKPSVSYFYSYVFHIHQLEQRMGLVRRNQLRKREPTKSRIICPDSGQNLQGSTSQIWRGRSGIEYRTVQKSGGQIQKPSGIEEVS